ncbi:hypothetical protein evm_014143 [Chilo suppressalis]|nr:hypothetical protein evm_014143 [Chilo suppressalis]
MAKQLSTGRKKNFYMLNKMMSLYGFTRATCSFFEASHGKGAADGIGGATKRNLDRYLTHGQDIPDAKAAYNALVESASSKIIFFFVSDEDVDAGVKGLDSTRKIEGKTPKTIKRRRFEGSSSDTEHECEISCAESDDSSWKSESRLESEFEVSEIIDENRIESKANENNVAVTKESEKNVECIDRKAIMEEKKNTIQNTTTAIKNKGCENNDKKVNKSERQIEVQAKLSDMIYSINDSVLVRYYEKKKWFWLQLYGVMGRCADVVMVNGTWTEDHINDLWRIPFSTHRVYPPCEVAELKQLRSLVKESDPIRILSVGQFRPEKDHPLMLQAMYELRNLLVKNELLWNKMELVLVGSCRHSEDEQRVRQLQDLARHLSLEDSVKFVVNAPYARLLQLYQTSSIALHAMWNEHFGIGVVECMAAGLVTIAHRSGGPLADIIETAPASRTGYLASEPDEYARAILEAVALSGEERRNIVEAAR